MGLSTTNIDVSNFTIDVLQNDCYKFVGRSRQRIHPSHISTFENFENVALLRVFVLRALNLRLVSILTMTTTTLKTTTKHKNFGLFFPGYIAYLPLPMTTT